MAIALVGSAFANSSGASTSTTPGFTLPASIPNTGSFAVVVVMNNGTTATLTATGWTVTGPVSTTNGRAWCLTKAVTSADSSTSPSFTLSANNRWAVAGGVWTNVTAVDGVVSASDDSAGISTLTLPAYTPLSGACLAVALMAGSRAIANPNGITTVPAGYSAVLASAVTNEASANNYEADVATKQLVGGAGQGSLTGAWTGNTRDINFVVTLAPLNPSGTATLGGFGSGGTLTAGGVPAVASSGGLSGLGALAAAGTPAETGAAALGGAGTLAAAGAPAVPGSAALGGIGTLGGAGGPAHAGTAGLGGSGTLAAAGQVVAGAQLGGVGTLTAVKLRIGLVRVWDEGSQTWVEHVVKAWNGRAWVAHPAKTWNGSAWQAHTA